MKLKKIATLVAAAMVGLLAANSAALAAAIPAEAKSAVNVRTGPGTSFNRVDTLYAGERVTVRECQSGWCYVDHNGPDGWVSANYLRQVGSGSSGNSSNPPINFGMTFGPGGPTFSLSVGNAPPPPPAPPPTPRVCFYAGSNYTGANFCVTAGANENQLTGYWNDRISSLKVYGGANVQLCRNWNYSGACFGFSSNRANLPFQINNKASSFSTWN